MFITVQAGEYKAGPGLNHRLLVLIYWSAASSLTMLFKFGTFELDLRRRELRNRGVRLRLRDQSFDILILLVQRPGEIVTREAIRESLWPDDTVVEFEHSINSAVNRLRSILGDSPAKPRFIETLPRLGYRFLAPIEVSEPPLQPIAQPLQNGSSEADTPDSIGRSRRRQVSIAAALLAVAAAAGVLGWWTSRRPFPQPGSIRSIAVLPFTNRSGSTTHDYLADGMTGELTSRLARFTEFTVISHTSVSRYRNRTNTVPEIGRELNVDAVLEGAVQVSNQQVRVTARLIDTHTDKHLWSDSYERDFRDALVLQSDIALAIATGIRIKTAPQEMAQLATRRSVRSDALEAYLKGRYALELGGVSDQGFSHFKEAVRLDPDFALGWALLAQRGSALLQQDDAPLSDEVLSAAKRALQLDDRLAEAHVALGDIEFLWNWNRDRAETEYLRAIELSPGSLDARVHYAWFKMLLGDFDIGLSQMQRAVELDPLSPVVSSAFGAWLGRAGQHQRALVQLQRSIKISPTYASNYTFLAHVREELSQDELALDARLKAAALNGQSPESIERVRSLFRSGGIAAVNKRDAIARLRRLTSRSARFRVPPFSFASAYAALGDKERALEWLEKAYAARSPRLPTLRLHHDWDSLRSDSAVQNLLARMKLP